MNPIQTRRFAGRVLAAFTLVEVLISIFILALGVLGLGVLFPVVIREQRIGVDAVTGVQVSNSARAVLTTAQWGDALALNNGMDHPARGWTEFLWIAMRDPLASYGQQPRPLTPIFPGLQARPTGPIPQVCLGQGYDAYNPASVSNFQPYAQGEWFTQLIEPASGTVYLGLPRITAVGQTGQVNIAQNDTGPNEPFNGFVTLSLAQRLYPLGDTPSFVWDLAVQRVTNFDHTRYPGYDAVRAVVFVRRIDPRIRVAAPATSLRDALTRTDAAHRVPVGELPPTDTMLGGTPTLDGTDGSGGVFYSPIHTAQVEFWYDSPSGTYTHRDRLYCPNAFAGSQRPPQNRLKVEWALMKQPGQKLVDNMGNIYTVVGSGNEGNFSRDVDGDGMGDYVRIDPPVPEFVTPDRAQPVANETSYTGGTPPPPVKRAVWQVAFTPQVPVSVTLVQLAGGKGQ